MNGLQGRKALVTGESSGIGQAIALNRRGSHRRIRSVAGAKVVSLHEHGPAVWRGGAYAGVSYGAAGTSSAGAATVGDSSNVRAVGCGCAGIIGPSPAGSSTSCSNHS